MTVMGEEVAVAISAYDNSAATIVDVDSLWPTTQQETKSKSIG